MSGCIEIGPGILSMLGLVKLMEDYPGTELTITERGWYRLTPGPLEPTQDFGITEQL